MKEVLKDIVFGLVKSKRMWLTVAGGGVLLMGKMHVAVPEGFADKFAEMVMVLVGSFGLTGMGKDKAEKAPELMKPND